MRKLKRLVALATCATMMMGSSAMAATEWSVTLEPGDTAYDQSVDANEITVKSSFSKKWSQKIQVKFDADGAEIWAMAKIGYDTFWTNEDYITSVGGVCSGFKVRGTIKNSNGTSESTSWKTSTLSGKADVKHTGKAVDYKFTLKCGN